MFTSFPTANLWLAFADSGAIGQGIILVQIILSVLVWSIMIGKYFELKECARLVKDFRARFSSSPDVLAVSWKAAARNNSNPLSCIYFAAVDKMRQLSANNARISVLANESEPVVNATEFELVKSTTEEELAVQMSKTEGKMEWLAIGTTIAPMLGLLGTVWGVLDAFQAMASKGVVLLSEVAPGISSALLTTVVGLFVAIPSGGGYNLLLSRVEKLNISFDGFTDELLARLKCQLEKKQ